MVYETHPRATVYMPLKFTTLFRAYPLQISIRHLLKLLQRSLIRLLGSLPDHQHSCSYVLSSLVHCTHNRDFHWFRITLTFLQGEAILRAMCTVVSVPGAIKCFHHIALLIRIKSFKRFKLSYMVSRILCVNLRLLQTKNSSNGRYHFSQKGIFIKFLL